PETGVHDGIDRTSAVIEAGVLVERDGDVVIRRAVTPQDVSFQVDHHLTVRTDRADIELVAVIPGAPMGGASAEATDRPVRVAHADRVVELHLRTLWRRHEREDVLAAEVREPRRDAECMGELRLSVAAA